MNDQSPTSFLERRTGNRSRVALRAMASARNSIDGVDCLVRDATASGCRIVSSNLPDLPDRIWLTFEGVRKPVEGRIVWREGKQAGVRLDWGAAGKPMR